MFALFQIVALCAAADGAPGYTVHVRELTAPERAIRVQLTGAVTVLDAVASLQRQPGDPGRMDLWVVRPNAGGTNRVLPVDWAAITQRGVTVTNYQVLAGDRLFLQARLAK